MDSALLPFKINGEYSVYSIEDMTDEQIDVVKMRQTEYAM
jgi:hypothetical protein